MGSRISTEFREINLQDRAWMERCRDPERNPFTALSFPSLFTWRIAYGLEVAGNEEAFVVRSRQDQACFCPCGTEAGCRELMEALTENEKHMRVVYLTEEQADAWAKQGFTVRLREDLSEYLASADAVALRAGHMSKSFKEKCRHFKRDIRYEVSPVYNGNIDKVIALAERLRNDEKEEKMGDIEVVMSEIESFRKLDLRGLLLETDDGRVGFIFGYENRPGMFTMSMAKHDRGLPAETTAVLIHELTKQIVPQYSLINLEEDLGLPGLRRAKMLFSPVGKLEVYEAAR
ncbi:MAG: DUF2156 domain-containing protein [Clostridia bacterium]|nr:DUF2156 domain-containing protein [Clostridia bacterium]